MQKFEINLLEIEISTKCNLRCKGCTSFSDYEISSGDESWGKNIEWLETWAKRINVKSIAIGGGEPTMHPEIIECITSLRRIFPHAMIDLITNGTYLIKRPEVVSLLREIGHACLTVSFHEPNKRYSNRVRKFLLDMYDWKPCEFRADWLETNNSFYLELRDCSTFWSPLKGQYGNVRPHHSDPEKSFPLCCFKDTLNYYQGKLYKCTVLQNLPTMLKDWGQDKDEDWQPFLDYKPLSVDCTDEELARFMSLVNRAESYCSMCPSDDMPNSKYSPRGQWKKAMIPIAVQ